MSANVTYRNMPRCSAVDGLVRDLSDRLFRQAPQVRRCDVCVELPREGNDDAVQIELEIASGERFVIERRPEQGPVHLELLAQVRAAFRLAEDWLRRRGMLERTNSQSRMSPWASRPKRLELGQMSK